MHQVVDIKPTPCIYSWTMKLLVFSQLDESKHDGSTALFNKVCLVSSDRCQPRTAARPLHCGRHRQPSAPGLIPAARRVIRRGPSAAHGSIGRYRLTITTLTPRLDLLAFSKSSKYILLLSSDWFQMSTRTTTLPTPRVRCARMRCGAAGTTSSAPGGRRATTTTTSPLSRPGRAGLF